MPETLTQVFSGEFYEIYMKTFFKRTPPVAVSGARLISSLLPNLPFIRRIKFTLASRYRLSSTIKI